MRGPRRGSPAGVLSPTFPTCKFSAIAWLLQCSVTLDLEPTIGPGSPKKIAHSCLALSRQGWADAREL